MAMHRILPIALVAAAFSAGVPAQVRIALDDETIFVAVEDALHYSRTLAGSDIHVKSREGYITLSGFVRKKEDIDTAARLALRVRGVTGVDNRIRIADRPARG